MKEGFAAHQIMLNGKKLKGAIAIVEDGVLTELKGLDRETPFTRFFDGMLAIEHAGANESEVEVGSPVSIWQIYPYDLISDCELSNSRKLRIK